MVRDAIRGPAAAGATGEARRLGLRHQRRDRRLPQGEGSILVRAGQETRDPGHRDHPRPGVDPGALPGAVVDPATGGLISDAEVAEVSAFTAFGSIRHPVIARLIVRRIRDRARADELFPVWRHHPS
jgi:hypothetical protein